MYADPVANAIGPRDTSTCDTCRMSQCDLWARDSITKSREIITLDRGQRLEAEDSNGCMIFWVIAKGSAASCTIFADGRRQIVAVERTGDVVCGLMSGPSSQSWLEALEDCEIWKFDMSEDAPRLRKDPSFLSATFMIVHRRLTRSQDRISALGRLDSQERVLLYLAENAARHSAVDPVSPVTTLTMSREDIADYLGLNTETVSRLLTRIKKSGLIKFLNRSEYVVPDMAAIQRRLPVEVGPLTRSCNARMFLEALL